MARKCPDRLQIMTFGTAGCVKVPILSAAPSMSELVDHEDIGGHHPTSRDNRRSLRLGHGARMTSLTRREFGKALGAGLLFASRARAQSGPEFIPDGEILTILADRVDVQKKSFGMVVGLIEPGSRRSVGYGSLQPNSGLAPNGQTLFGIGSIGKMFTAVLLGDMLVRREVGLDDPVEDHLPKGMRVAHLGRPITLADLATHTSGLPVQAPGMTSTAGYTPQAFAEFLAAYEPKRAPGERFEYSNAGYALLAMALCERAGVDYEHLVARRIAGPLGLKSTFVTVPASQRARLAQGHDAKLEPFKAVELSAFSRMGAIYSTANDLLTFIGMADGKSPTPLGRAFALLPLTRRVAPAVGEQALGWEVKTVGGSGPFFSKDGIGQGYGASVVFDPGTGQGVVVLSNVESLPSDIARHLLRPAIPLARSYVVVEMDPSQFGRFIGIYQIAPGRSVTVAIDKGRLTVQLPGLAAKLPLSALESPPGDVAFVSQQIGVEFAFRVDGQGQATAVAFHGENGAEVVAYRAQ
jgi:D-alanyl-D-alanine-carboxypeptidase/D-alanyl-D-alanine-endopeptidase